MNNTTISVSERREQLEKTRAVDLTNIGSFTLDEQIASKRNCENMIGAAQVPLGIAGPLRLRSGQAHDDYYIPLATTEGALVASVNRGCKAIAESGGAMVQSFRVGATRGPVFKVRSMEENSTLFDFLEGHREDFRRIAAGTSVHIGLTRVETKSVGLYRFVRFDFDTSDAMGLNMVTIATDAIVRFVEKETGVRCVSLSGNFCVDKKPSWQNAVYGRGFEVWAEVVIPGQIVASVLKTTPEAFYETWLAKCMIGSAVSGSMGFNAHYANVLAALFIATGQDPAHVAECSIGITTAEVRSKRSEVRGQKLEVGEEKEPLYVSVYLPDLMVGTVGGGTGLATQKEALSLLGVCGGNDGKNVEKLATIVGGALLAGEISLLASLSEGSLARAHERLGRGKHTVKSSNDK